MFVDSHKGKWTLGQVEFNSYYQSVYQERWAALLAALKSETLVQFSLQNSKQLVAEMPHHKSGETIPRDDQGRLSYYVLDPASLLVARALPISDHSKVLDMCAAPGGKSLVLFSQSDATTQLICNELSPGRREALKKVIQNYISLEDRENRVWIRGQDGVQFGLRSPEEFDAILLDAPCSGEAHLLENKAEMENWSKRRTEGLSIKQYSLLSSAWTAVKPGGFILYSTCSISPLENDGVIAKLLKRKKSEVEVVRPQLEIEPEWTEHGFQYFPDRSKMGPMFGCLLKKVN